MDTRDKLLLQHHKRRLVVAASYSTNRQLQDAERHLQIAIRQHRLLYAALMQAWVNDLRANELRGKDNA